MSLGKSNPFATRFVAPGELAWIASDETRTLDALRDRFVNQLVRRGAIVGPHGSGKSTLLEHLVPTLGTVRCKVAAYEQTSLPDIQLQAGEVIWLRLRGKLPSLQLVHSALKTATQPNLLLVVDGYEQIPWVMRLKMLLVTRKRRQGILITTHQSTWLETLIQTRITVDLALATLDRLVPDNFPNRSNLLEPTKVEELLRRHQGNLREVFMDLYDTIS